MMPSPRVGSGVDVRQTAVGAGWTGALETCEEAEGLTFDVVEGEDAQAIELRAVRGNGQVQADAAPRAWLAAFTWRPMQTVSSLRPRANRRNIRELDDLRTVQRRSARAQHDRTDTHSPKENAKVRLASSRHQTISTSPHLDTHDSLEDPDGALLRVLRERRRLRDLEIDQSCGPRPFRQQAERGGETEPDNAREHADIAHWCRCRPRSAELGMRPHLYMTNFA